MNPNINVVQYVKASPFLFDMRKDECVEQQTYVYCDIEIQTNCTLYALYLNFT